MKKIAGPQPEGTPRIDHIKIVPKAFYDKKCFQLATNFRPPVQSAHVKVPRIEGPELVLFEKFLSREPQLYASLKTCERRTFHCTLIVLLIVGAILDLSCAIYRRGHKKSCGVINWENA